MERIKQLFLIFYSRVFKTFSRKIMSILLVSMSLAIGFASVIYYWSTVDILKKEYINSNSLLLQEVNQTIQRYFNQLNDVTLSLYNDSFFIDNLRMHDDSHSAMAYNERKIKSILYSNDSIEYIYFYTPDNRKLYSYSHENMSYSSYPELENEDWYQNTVNSDHFFYVSPLHTFKNYKHFGSLKNNTVFSVNRALKYYSSKEFIGVISISYNTNYLKQICQNLMSQNSYIAIFNKDMKPLLNTGPDSIFSSDIKTEISHTDSDEGYYNYEVNGKQRILLWDRLDGKYLFKDIPLDELTRNAVTVLKIIFSISVLIFILSIIMAFYFSKSVTHRLNKLSKKMTEFGDGRFAINAEDYGTDEIGALALTFTEMTRKINELINSEYKQKMLKKTAELQALQAQLKPHFINNVLQALGTLGLQKGAADVYDMSIALAKTLRYSLKSTTELVPLKTEIENMNNYLYIQKILWDDRLIVNLHIEKELENHYVPVFILQPLVENAIKHGLDSNIEGLIKIVICSEKSSLSIKVIDNGIGISEEKMAKLNEWLNEPETVVDTEEHVGIRNIVSRIRLIYGEQASFFISSQPGNGTSIHIILPKEE